MRTPAILLAAIIATGLTCTGHAQNSSAEKIEIDSGDYSIATANIDTLAKMMADGRLTSERLTQIYLDRIAQIDDAGPKINAIIAIMPDALDQARRLDAERTAGQVRGPLHGIPIILKDNIEAAGPLPTTAGSTALLRNVTNRDAPLVARLRAAGAVIIAKANLSQWANIRSNNSTSGWTSVGGLVRNPYALDRNSCGSSSGSGAAIAASLGGGAVGTETDGSVVCPSTINGIVGFKPTLGMISRTHIIPISHSQDTAGPMTRSVYGTAAMLSAMAGSDPADGATQKADSRKTDFTQGLSKDGLKGKNIGVLRDRTGDDPRLIALFNQAVSDLKAAGAQIVEIADSRDGLEDLGEAEFKVLMTELKADMAAYLSTAAAGVPYKTLKDLIAFNVENAAAEMPWFGQELFELGESQKGLDDPEYLQALETARTLSRGKIDGLLAQYEVNYLVGPSGGPAWISDLVLGDRFTGPSQSQLPAISGYPHLTVPMGYIQGLPIGLSFIGTAWDDHGVIKVGYAYEQATKHRKEPTYIPTIGDVR